MDRGREDALDKVAMSVSDGAAIPWEHVGADVPEEKGALEELALIERIRDVYDQAGRDLGDDDTDTATAAALPALSAFAGEPPLFTWGPLRVLEKIGGGSGGDVYRAYDPSLQTELALKFPKERGDESEGPGIEKFLAEARRLARVRHPNVLVVHGADRHDGRAGIWTEYVRGVSLDRYLSEHGPLSSCEAALIGLDLCRALAAVHSAGLVHRDVKASNVMRERGGRIVLMDFGTVVEAPRGGDGASVDVTGTPITMAPEQLRGDSISPATDIYGLGVLLYRLVSGHYPIEAENLEDLSRRHRRGERVPLRDRRADLPLGFVEVVERAISPDPTRRYATAGAMEQALSSTLRAKTEPDGLRLLVAAVLGVLITAGAVGIWFATGGFEDRAAGRPSNGGGAALSAEQQPLAAGVTLLRRKGSMEDTLSHGALIRPGDRLSMRIEGSDTMNVYVLNSDLDGNVYVLYPIPGLAPSNPLPSGVRHRLPGALEDSLVFWNVTSAGGKDRVVAIASREPVTELESVLAQLPRAKRGRPITPGLLSRENIQRLRGIGGVSTQPALPSDAKNLLQESIDALVERSRRTGDVFIWETTLENPAP
ncbi:MAG TPA: serine/threonine-protein kinase [Candidatus Eisenbacteria bacterium]|nr:serine/threonine-protein kinase [Candidatus Eisenbacteria bacterium]